jgi:O-antigen/teichoic acid export membrane protein
LTSGDVAPAVGASVDNFATGKRGAIRNSVITLGGYGATSVLRFASNLILTRLLLPEQFGVMALVSVIITSLYLFSDIGIGPNIIQSRRGEDPTFLNTAWTLGVFRGITLWIIACVAAWPLSHFYGQPQITQLLPVTGLMAVAGGFESTRTFTENRRLALGRITAIDFASQAAGILFMVVVALETHSVWALVVGTVLTSIIKTVLSHTVLPGVRNRFAWDSGAGKAIVEFGRWIFLSTAFACLAGQSDQLILGKLISARQLGIYSIAAHLAAVPAQVIGQLAQRVLYPYIASALRRGDYERSSVRRNNTRLLLAVAPVIAMGIVLAPPVISLLYRSEYWEVGPLVSCLTIGTWLGAMSSSYNVTLLAAGMPKYMLGNIGRTVFFSALIYFAWTRFGLTGVAVLVSLSELGNLAIAMFGCRLIGTLSLKANIGTTLFLGAYAALCKVLYEVSLRAFHGLRLAAIAAVVSLTGVVVAALARRLKLV